MKQFLITIAGVFAGLLLFFVGVPLLLVIMTIGAVQPAAPPARAILSLDLRQPIVDQASPSPFSVFSARSLSVLSTIGALDHARHDGRVKALLVRLPEGGVSPAVAEEIGAAIRAFRASGRPVLAYSQGLYPSGISTATYSLGAASGQFWMQPASSLQSVGLASQDLFFKRAFDKYGVTADYEQREQYKTAVNPFLYSDYTPAHRESELGWMTSIYSSELAEAAADRKQAPDRLRAALEAGPYQADEAMRLGLVDRVGDLEAARLALEQQVGGGAKLVDFDAYRNSLRTEANAAAPTIAVIGAEGEIKTGTAKNEALNASGGVFSDDVANAFRAAAADDGVKAIVFRISSPGGSDTASEEILSAVRAAKAVGKPVVVSMGTYAASGGYWIASQASEIVAEPATLTGSIGVFGGKFVTGPALARFGVDTRSLGVGGDYASAFGSGEPFTPAQRLRFSHWMDTIYQGFIARVAEGRHLPIARVQEIAKGRVWTGAQAKQLGLVDRLGGFPVAVAEAGRLAGLPAGHAVQLRLYPARRSPFDAVRRMFSSGAAATRTLGALASILSDPAAADLVRAAAHARAGADAVTVLAPGLPH